MKKTIIFLGIIIFLASCKEKSPVEYEYPVVLNSKKAAQLIEADNKFALDIFKEIETQTDELNFMISPVSISIALGMAYNGAEGDTKSAFEKTMRMTGLTQHEINKIHGSLITQLKKADPKVKMEIANAIWLHNQYTLARPFADTNVYYYGAEVNTLDFFGGKAEETMNNWVSNSTHGKITEIIDNIPPLAVSYLMNAIYFYGTWTYQFDKKNSESMLFHYSDGTTKQVQSMQIKRAFDYYSNDSFSAVDLPYGNNNFSMTIFLPSEGKNIKDLMNVLTYSNWNKWIEEFANTPKVFLQLPKFKYSFESSLNESLNNMGLGIAFTDQADFPGIVQENIDLHISEVIHKTYIDVNEDGTEAAAVTSIGFETTSVGPPSPVMIVDRPFLYVIREKTTGCLVFMGKVGSPEYE